MSNKTIHAFIDNSQDRMGITGEDFGVAKRLLHVSAPKTDAILEDIEALLSSLNTIPAVQNINVAVANTEQSFALPANCKSFIIKPVQSCYLSIAYQSGGPYFKCGLGSSFQDNNKYTIQTIYFKVNRVNTDVDIITYI